MKIRLGSWDEMTFVLVGDFKILQTRSSGL